MLLYTLKFREQRSEGVAAQLAPAFSTQMVNTPLQSSHSALSFDILSVKYSSRVSEKILIKNLVLLSTLALSSSF